MILTIRFWRVEESTTTPLPFNTLSFQELSVNGDAIPVTSAIEDPSNPNDIRLDLNLNEIWTTAALNINVTDGTYSYTNGFTIFGYDLIFDIYFPSAVTYPAKAIAYRQPVTNNIYIYNASATLGDIRYIAEIAGEPSTELYFDNGVICETRTVNIRQVKKLYRWEGCNKVYFGESTQYAPTQVQKNFPHDTEFSVSLTCPTCSENCTNFLKENSAVAFISPNNTMTYTVDGVQQQFITRDTLDFKLRNFENQIIASTNFSHNYPTVYNPDNYKFNFKLDNIGDYVLETTKISFSGDTPVHRCVHKTKIRNCHWFEYTKDAEICNQVNFYNWSYDNAQMVVNQYINKQWTTIGNYTLVPGGTRPLQFQDGVYRVLITRGADRIEVPIVMFCKVKECVEALVNDLACKDICNDDCTQIEFYHFNAIMSTFTTLLMIYNDLVKVNSIVPLLIPSKLEKLLTADELLTKLERYCFDCGKLEKQHCRTCS